MLLVYSSQRASGSQFRCQQHRQSRSKLHATRPAAADLHFSLYSSGLGLAEVLLVNMSRWCALAVALVGLLTVVLYAEAQEILCPQHKHLEGEVQKCKELLPDLSGKKEKLAALSIRYGLRCAREVDPDISLPDIKERRCKNDDPQDFPRKFYQCWNRLLDTDALLTRVGFSGDELDRFRGAAKCVNNVIERTLTE